MTQSPVAFFVFNRPALTARVFESIRRARPAKLLLVADGPRKDHPSDAGRCQEVLEIISRVDWPCDVYRQFSGINLGCKERVSSGLDWTFKMVDRAIVLEDDCWPAPDFFPFCDSMLDRYAADTRIMQVCGNNLAGKRVPIIDSYSFSKIGPIWGWASWRRAWTFYDVDMKSWPKVVEEKIYEQFWDLSHEISFRFPLYQEVYSGKVNTWDIQWGYAKLLQRGLSIIPAENLISNLGFDDGSESTHTGNKDHPAAALPCGGLQFPLRHPTIVERNKRLELGIDTLLSGRPLSLNPEDEP